MAPGELCLGGDQLAEGYLNLPEKTREVFINNPFGSGRLYRTGDMVIANEDGTIELIGRIDQQTKIDGQRVEPNESNFIIQAQPGVVQSSVVSAFILNRNALVAVLVPEKDREWTSLIRDVRSALRAQLPSYAIPRYWVPRDEIPLNVSGKIDISSLRKIVESMDAGTLIKLSMTSPIPSPKSSSLSLPLLETEDMSEPRIAGTIASVLSIPRETVDLEASFQELGGSSLDAIVVASNLRKIGIHIAVADILQSESIREMAASCTEAKLESVVNPLPFSLLPQGTDINLAGLEDAYSVTPLQEGILADSILGNANYVYQRVYKLQGVTPSQVRAAMNTVISRSSILRTIFFPWKRSFLQAVKQTAVLPWTVVRGRLWTVSCKMHPAQKCPSTSPSFEQQCSMTRFSFSRCTMACSTSGLVSSSSKTLSQRCKEGLPFRACHSAHMSHISSA
jgi:acyl carrier protein